MEISKFAVCSTQHVFNDPFFYQDSFEFWRSDDGQWNVSPILRLERGSQEVVQTRTCEIGENLSLLLTFCGAMLERTLRGERVDFAAEAGLPDIAWLEERFYAWVHSFTIIGYSQEFVDKMRQVVRDHEQFTAFLEHQFHVIIDDVDFQMEIKASSNNGQEISIHGISSQSLLLPWTISEGRNSIRSFDWRISLLLSRIMPDDVINADVLAAEDFPENVFHDLTRFLS